MLVRGSGFEDTVFESELCTAGSLQGVLAGSHYNRCWNVHNIFAESLERLFLTRFLAEKAPIIPDCLRDLSTDSLNTEINDDLFEKLQVVIHNYEMFKESARKGAIGKTAQFWVLYMDLMRYQVMAHTAVQENDTDMLVYCWKLFLPMYFAMNKIHYAR